jgi:hypothetical protein
MTLEQKKAVLQGFCASAVRRLPVFHQEQVLPAEQMLKKSL